MTGKAQTGVGAQKPKPQRLPRGFRHLHSFQRQDSAIWISPPTTCFRSAGVRREQTGVLPTHLWGCPSQWVRGRGSPERQDDQAGDDEDGGKDNEDVVAGVLPASIVEHLGRLGGEGMGQGTRVRSSAVLGPRPSPL